MRKILIIATFLPSLTLAQAVPPAAPPATPPAAAPAAPAAPPVAKRDRKPLVAVVLPGVKRVPHYPRVRVYTSPRDAADPAPEASPIKAVEITEENEAPVLQHPTSAPLLGAIVQGARVPVKGVINSPNNRGCSTRLWYALEPFGYICSRQARPTTEALSTEAVLKVATGERVPFHYVMLGIKEGAEPLPMWSSLESAQRGEEPERKLENGDTVAIERTVRVGGAAHYVSVEGKVLPVRGTFALGKEISEWRGEDLGDKTAFPFGWINPDQARVMDGPGPKAKPIDKLGRRTRVAILEESGVGPRRMLRVADGRWVRAADVNEVRRIARPAGITPARQWIDVDLGEQVLVAYEGDKPVFATLVSSGRAVPTPRGDYPVWAKVSSISMKSQPYEDKAYFVNKVPWVLFFQAHNAIHGAYWHDRFGTTKSHGCVNVAPLDARHLFEWFSPGLPAAWTGYRPADLLASGTVHLRNSRQKVEWVQERPIGPPDKELEAQKLEDAELRRAVSGEVKAP